MISKKFEQGIEDFMKEAQMPDNIRPQFKELVIKSVETAKEMGKKADEATEPGTLSNILDDLGYFGRRYVTRPISQFGTEGWSGMSQNNRERLGLLAGTTAGGALGYSIPALLKARLLVRILSALAGAGVGGSLGYLASKEQRRNFKCYSERSSRPASVSL